MDTFRTEVEVSEMLGLTVAALRRWRYEDRGPKFTKFGTAVRYRQSDLDTWLGKCPTGGGR